MNYCQFRNETIKRMAVTSSGGGLPAEYQQVEYLSSDIPSGSPYIVTTTPLTNTYYFEVKYKIVSDSFRFGLFGSKTTSYPIGAAQASVNGRMIIASNKDAYLPNALNEVYTVTAYYDSNAATYRAFINGSEASYRSDSGNTANNGFSVFMSNWTGGVTSILYIYYVKIKESIDGNTTLDLYPCYRKSDNKPGMYDLVTDTFFTNAGTGEFTTGNPV